MGIAHGVRPAVRAAAAARIDMVGERSGEQDSRIGFKSLHAAVN